MTIPKLEAVLPHCRVRPTLIEMEMHPCFQQPELYEYCLAQGVQPVGFCPVGSPARPDRDIFEGDKCDTKEPVIVRIAEKHAAEQARNEQPRPRQQVQPQRPSAAGALLWRLILPNADDEPRH